MTNSKVIKTLVCPAVIPKAYKVQTSRMKGQRIVKILGSKTALMMIARNSIIQRIKTSHSGFLNIYSMLQVTFLNNEK